MNKNTLISHVLDEQIYWSIIDICIPFIHDQGKYCEVLKGELQKLSLEDVVSFQLCTEKLANEIYTSDMWCAAFIINDGSSDDGFEYFRYWVIAQGKALFEKAKAHPDDLVDHVEVGKVAEFETFSYVPGEIVEERTGTIIMDHIDIDVYRSLLVKEIMWTWSETDLESQKEVCPKLWEKFKVERVN